MIPQKNTNRKVFVAFTQEEYIYFSKIFNLLDYEKRGKISSDSVFYFLRDSRLNDKVLKELFVLICQKDINYIDKDEFFIMLRLLALAQNNIPFNVNSLQKNTPIPPLPIFVFFQKTNLLLKENLFEITDNLEKTYLKIFNEKKDTRKDYISKLRTLLIWNEKNPNNTNINEEIMKSLEPLKHKDFLNKKEFIVGCYLLFLSRIIKMPIKLPKSLLKYIGRNTTTNTINNYNYNNNNITNQNNKIYSIELKKEYMKASRNNNNKGIYNIKNVNQFYNQDEKTKTLNNNIINQKSNKNNKSNLINIDKKINYKEMDESGLEIDNTLKLLEEAKQKKSISLSNSKTTTSHSNNNSSINQNKIEKKEYVYSNNMTNYIYSNNSIFGNNNINSCSFTQAQSQPKNNQNLLRTIASNQNISSFFNNMKGYYL